MLSIFLGFVLGFVATAIVWNLTQRHVRNPETTRLTALWSVKDLTEPGTRPGIIAESIEGISFQPGSKVIVPRTGLADVPPQVLATCEVRMHPEVRLNAAVGKDRALIFSGSITPKAFAVYTQDTQTVRLIQEDFQRMWGESVPYIEHVASISQLAEKNGRYVDIQGHALELMEYRGRKMLRLTDGKTNVGVVTEQQDVAEYQGRQVRVVGRMTRENGMAYLKAERVVAA